MQPALLKTPVAVSANPSKYTAGLIDPALVGLSFCSIPCARADEAERGRSSITKEQLSAAQVAVQRSLRGLIGPDAARTLEGDSSLAADSRALTHDYDHPPGEWRWEGDTQGIVK